MRFENILNGFTVPRVVPTNRMENMNKQLSTDQKTLFFIKNRIPEIVRLNKMLAKVKGLKLNSLVLESITAKHQSAISKILGGR